MNNDNDFISLDDIEDFDDFISLDENIYVYSDNNEKPIVGDIIRDVEDSDFYFEGEVTSVQLYGYYKYKLLRVFCNGESIDDDDIGNIIGRRWTWTEYSISNRRNLKLKQLGL